MSLKLTWTKYRIFISSELSMAPHVQRTALGFKVSLWRGKRRRMLTICFTRFFKTNVVNHSFLSGGFICPFYRFDVLLEVSPVVLGKAASSKVSFKAVFLTRMVCRAGLVPSKVKFVWSFPSETYNNDRHLNASVSEWDHKATISSSKQPIGNLFNPQNKST